MSMLNNLSFLPLSQFSFHCSHCFLSSQLTTQENSNTNSSRSSKSSWALSTSEYGYSSGADSARTAIAMIVDGGVQSIDSRFRLKTRVSREWR